MTKRVVPLIIFGLLAAMASVGPARAQAVDTNAPAAPTLLLPLPGVTYEGDTSPMHFEWSAVTDPSGIVYHIVIHDAADPTVIVKEEGDLAGTSIDFFLPDGNYGWYVYATDGAPIPNVGPPSETWYCQKDNPPAPKLTWPPRGDTLDTHTIKFQWTSVEDPSGPCTYHIVVRDIADPAIIIQEASGITSNSIDLLLFDGVYAWAVQATDGQGNVGPWSDVWDCSVVAVDTAVPDTSVIAPNGGEILIGGDYWTITWYLLDDLTSTPDLLISLYYYCYGYNGDSWQTIVEKIHNDGYFIWSVPSNVASDNCFIKLTAEDADGNVGLDVSDYAFTILSCSSSSSNVEVCSPHGLVSSVSDSSVPSGTFDSSTLTKAVSFSLSSVTSSSADVTVTYPMLPDGTVFSYMGNGSSEQILPATGFGSGDISNVALTDNVLSFTIQDNSGADSNPSSGGISEMIAATAEGTPTSSDVSLSTDSSEGGEVSPSEATVPSGARQTFEIHASKGHRIKDVVVDGVSQGPKSKVNVVATKPASVEASFLCNSDLDGDGTTDLSDAMSALRMALRVSGRSAADAGAGVADVAPLVDGVPASDSTVTIGDVVVILRKSEKLADW